MLASYRWLRELCRTDASIDEVSKRLTEAGLEVEGLEHFGQLPGVVIAEVRGKRAHPEREKLNLVTLFDGDGEIEVVCGASNVPETGGRVLFAREGAELPGGMKIGARKLGGIESRGMICSETELNIGNDERGIFIVDPGLDAAPGTLAQEALELVDTVFEIGLTPNRPDCLGHLGLARELAALLGCELQLPSPSEPTQLSRVAEPPPGTRPVPLFDGDSQAPPATTVGIRVHDAERCPRYAACAVEDVTIGVSPFWLRYRLHVLGLRAINNAVDVTNYVLMEYGYPTHAFDLEQVRGGQIEVRVARAGEKVVTLDGEQHDVGDDDLLICDGEGPVAVAGVMGGERSGVQESTTRILVETAYFDPRSVRRTSRRLGLHTDSSHRFERGVDPRAVPGVLARVVGLLADVTGGVPCQHGYEIYDNKIAPQTVRLRAGRCAALLGLEIPVDTCRDILQALGCVVQLESGDSMRVQVPTWRPDLGREVDLIEEVARVYGYDNLPTETPRPRSSQDGTPPFVRFIRSLKVRCAQAGLTECVNYAFVSPEQHRLARVPTDAVRLANPLSEERSVMRTSLLPGLAANARRAQRHQVERVEIFEVARVFEPQAGPLPIEHYRLGILLSGPQRAWIGGDQPMDFYDGKGMLQAVFEPLTGRSASMQSDTALAAECPFLHPRRCARIVLSGTPVGVLGELHPDVLDDLELTGPVVYAEVDAAVFFDTTNDAGAVQVTSVPRFPASMRDLSVVVDEDVEAGSVMRTLTDAGGDLLESVELFDLYRGDQLADGKKSLAFRLVYRDAEGTLTDKRVDKAHKKVVSSAEKKFSASLRA